MRSINKLAIVILFFLISGCQFSCPDGRSPELLAIPPKPEMTYLDHDSVVGSFKYKDTILSAKTYTAIFKGNVQSISSGLTDPALNEVSKRVKMRFVNNPWSLTKNDSILVLFSGK